MDYCIGEIPQIYTTGGAGIIGKYEGQRRKWPTLR